MSRLTRPHPVFDLLIEKFNLKNDRGLCHALSLEPPVVSKIRTGKIAGRCSVCIAIHETFGMSFQEMRDLAGPHFVPVRPPKKATNA